MVVPLALCDWKVTLISPTFDMFFFKLLPKSEAVHKELQVHNECNLFV